jgi:WD40 repeat protein
MQLAANENCIVTGLEDQVKVFDARMRVLSFAYADAHSSPIICARATPDLQSIVTTSEDSTVKVWDVRQQRLLKTYSDDCLQCDSDSKLCISPNSQFVVVGTKQGHIAYINLQDPRDLLDSIVRGEHSAPVIDVLW